MRPQATSLNARNKTQNLRMQSSYLVYIFLALIIAFSSLQTLSIPSTLRLPTTDTRTRRNTFISRPEMSLYCVFVATLLYTRLALVAAQSPSPAPAWSMLRGGKSDFASLATPITACLLLRGLSWTTEEGAILLNGRHHFHMKGLTW